MLGFIFRKAQATVDSAIESVVNGVIISVPFILAGAFAIAALAGWLHNVFDSVTANLLLAVIFAAAGGILAAVLNRPSGEDPLEADVNLDAELPQDKIAGEASGFASFGSADRDLLMSALAAGGPVALPILARNWRRAVPLILALIAAAFVLARIGARDTDSPGLASAPEPAE